jgi:hypothetical protein
LLFGLLALAQTGYGVAADTVLLGSAPGQSTLTHGPAKTLVDMDSCRFSMPLLQDQWLTFDDFYSVFVASKQSPKPPSAPSLWQVPTSSGADWRFEKHASLSQPWFGLICQNAEDFSLLTDWKPPEDDAFAVQVLRDDNDRRCPATLTDQGWKPNELAGRANTYTFEQWGGEKSSGFIFGFHDKSKRHITRVAFCLLRGKDVLIGAAQSGSATPLSISTAGFEQIKTAVRSIAFE